MRTLIASFISLVFAGAATAATLTVVSDKSFYLPGETITLTVTGDGGGATAYSLLGRLVWSSPIISAGTTSQNSAGSPPWIVGPTTSGPGFIEVFNQIDGSFAGSQENFPGNVIATVTLNLLGPGIVQVDWFSNLSFFDLQGSRPAITISTGIPEPATATMLVLGLAGLAAIRRRA